MVRSRVCLLVPESGRWDALAAHVAEYGDVLRVAAVPLDSSKLGPIIEYHPQAVVLALPVTGETALSLLSALRQALPDAVLVHVAGGYPAATLTALARLSPAGWFRLDDLDDPMFPLVLVGVLFGEFVAASRSLGLAVAARAVSRSGSNGDTPEMSDVERRVVHLLAGGDTQATIAAALAISRSTVNAHLQRAMTKLGAVNSAHLVALAVQLGLVTVAPPDQPPQRGGGRKRGSGR